MSDLISRQAALKKFTYSYKGERIPDYDCDNFPTQISFVDVRKVIRELPSVEPEKCGDCISREAVKKILDNGWKSGVYPSAGSIDALPSVEPEKSQCSWYGEDGRCHFAEQEMDECDDCISRTELLKKQQIIIDEHGLEHKVVHIGKIIDAPSVEPERKPCYWTHDKDGWKCGACHNTIRDDDFPTCMGAPIYNYCPLCGEDMRGV